MILRKREEEEEEEEKKEKEKEKDGWLAIRGRKGTKGGERI